MVIAVSGTAHKASIVFASQKMELRPSNVLKWRLKINHMSMFFALVRYDVRLCIKYCMGI